MNLRTIRKWPLKLALVAFGAATFSVLSLTAAQDLHFAFAAGELTGPAMHSATGYVEMSLKNSAAEPVRLSVLRPREGRSSADYLTALEQLIASIEAGDMEAAQRAHGTLGEVVGFAGTVVAPPNGTRSGGFFLEPGEYVLTGTCDSCPPTAAPLTLTVADGPSAAPPTADFEIEMQDFKFHGVPAEMSAGAHVWDVTNTGTHAHVYALIRLADGRTLGDFMEWYEALEDPFEPLPAEFGEELAAGSFLDPGARSFETLDLAPGEYVIVCPIPEFSLGTTHLALGMVQGFSVR